MGMDKGRRKMSFEEPSLSSIKDTKEEIEQLPLEEIP